jgi:choline dehydrogenase
MDQPAHDYIIVGAGSAGCVLANRLTEDPKTRVLLIEAGGRDNHPFQNLPLYFFEILKVKRMSWGYESEPQTHLDGRKLDLPRGRVLGGSSAVNGMVYMRGHSQDFEGWRQMGCTGWGYADVLPYFKRMENFWGGADKYHGVGGPLSVTPTKCVPELHQRMMKAADAAGLGTTDDIHADVEEGFSRGDVTIDARGRRASASRSYLYPAMTRPNLTVISEALTTRILFEGKRAVGVEYRKDGTLQQARAGREVILSGGSFNSPQILMLSGIGPAEHLKEMGIDVLVDQPGVGQNYSDHPYTGLQYTVTRRDTMLRELRIDRATWAVLNWWFLGRGEFTSQIMGCNAAIRTREGLAQPDMQVYYNPIRMDAGIWWPNPFKLIEHQFAIALTLLHPLARGWVKLRSNDPADKPRINPNLLGDPADMATFVRSIRLMRKLVRTPPQDEVTGREVTPGDNVQTDDEIEAYVRETTSTMYHPVGTCTMGTSPEAVVDPELRVKGVEGLRVIDASVMPAVTGANTNAPTLMIAERGADLIRGRSLPPEEVRRPNVAA